MYEDFYRPFIPDTFFSKTAGRKINGIKLKYALTCKKCRNKLAMKKNLFSIIIAIGIFANVQAQISFKSRFQVSYPDASNKPLFDQHPDLNRIVISYKNDTAVVLTLCFRQTTNAVNEDRYNLAFEGDRYMLHRNYKKLIMPKPAKLAMQYFEGVQDRSQTGYRLVTTLHRDSAAHEFSYYTFVDDGKYPEPSPRHRARLKADVLQLQKKLTQNFKQWKPLAVTDSVLVITGIVERDGSFGKLELKSGDPSQFSKKVSEFIEREATNWTPAEQNVRTVRYQVKFFVRLNRDESITFSVL